MATATKLFVNCSESYAINFYGVHAHPLRNRGSKPTHHRRPKQAKFISPIKPNDTKFHGEPKYQDPTGQQKRPEDRLYTGITKYLLRNNSFERYCCGIREENTRPALSPVNGKEALFLLTLHNVV
jgi:hypothetical protein